MSDVEAIETLVSSALAKLNIKDYHLDITDCTGKGNGYVGKIWRVKVQHQSEQIDLIVKTAIDDDEHRNFLSAELLFRNEICVYATVFPAFDKFQKEKQVKDPFKIPKCYATCLEERKEALVLEDLKVLGFGMWDRKKALDEAHISLVLTQLGKFHALSLALRDQQPEVLEEAICDLKNVIPIIFPNFIEGFRSQILKNAKMLQQKGLAAESALANKVGEELEEIMYVSCAPDDEPYTVVIHGDCWCNNMMFNYDVSRL